MNLSNRKWVNEGASFLQVYASGGIGWNKNSQKLIDMDCPLSYIVVHWAMRGGGLRKNMIGETPCSHFRNSMSTDVCDANIHYLAVIVS